MQPHRLQELVREDLRRHPDSAIGEMWKRIGQESGRSQLKQTVAGLVGSGVVAMIGERAGARYRLTKGQ